MSAPKLTLNSGKEIPQLGFGTWLAAPGVVGESVQTAIKVPNKIKSNTLNYSNFTILKNKVFI